MQASVRLSSSAASRKVIAGASSTILRSCYRTSRGKAHATPLSAQEPPPKGQKRFSKQERSARIEEFVHKYRASNDGKFPTATNVQQQVGGSYYRVREILQGLEYNCTRAPLVNTKAAQLQETDEFAEPSRPKDELKAFKAEETDEYAEPSTPKDELKAFKTEETDEFAEHSRPKDDSKTAQLHGTAELSEHSKPKDVIGKNLYNSVGLKSNQDIADVLISQKDYTTISEKTETGSLVGSSHDSVEIDAAKNDLNNPETCKNTGGLTLSDQKESDNMKVLTSQCSPSLGVEAKSDPENQQGEIEAKKLDLNSTENSLNARKSTLSDQSGSDKVIEATIHDRELGPKQEPEESTNAGLLGSLKSFAYGIRNFWKNL